MRRAGKIQPAGLFRMCAATPAGHVQTFPVDPYRRGRVYRANQKHLPVATDMRLPTGVIVVLLIIAGVLGYMLYEERQETVDINLPELKIEAE